MTRGPFWYDRNRLDAWITREPPYVPEDDDENPANYEPETPDPEPPEGYDDTDWDAMDEYEDSVDVEGEMYAEFGSSWCAGGGNPADVPAAWAQYRHRWNGVELTAERPYDYEAERDAAMWRTGTVRSWYVR